MVVFIYFYIVFLAWVGGVGGVPFSELGVQLRKIGGIGNVNYKVSW